MKLSELINELQKIADQGKEWAEVEVERSGTTEENEKNGGTSEITSIDALDFGDHRIVLITTEMYSGD